MRELYILEGEASCSACEYAGVVRRSGLTCLRAPGSCLCRAAVDRPQIVEYYVQDITIQPTSLSTPQLHDPRKRVGRKKSRLSSRSPSCRVRSHGNSTIDARSLHSRTALEESGTMIPNDVRGVQQLCLVHRLNQFELGTTGLGDKRADYGEGCFKHRCCFMEARSNGSLKVVYCTRLPSCPLLERYDPLGALLMKSPTCVLSLPSREDASTSCSCSWKGNK